MIQASSRFVQSLYSVPYYLQKTEICVALVRTVVGALGARSAVGVQSASTVVSAMMQGVRWGINLRARSYRSKCKECGGASICEHGRRALLHARSVVGHQICEHGRRRSTVQGVRWGIESASTVVTALFALYVTHVDM